MSSQHMHILQVGNYDWSQDILMPDNIVWHWIPEDQIEAFVSADQSLNAKDQELQKVGLKITEPEIQYAALLITSTTVDHTVNVLKSLFAPYEVFYPERFLQLSLSKELKAFLTQMMAQTIDDTDREALVKQLSKYLFKGQYGSKLHITDIVLSPRYYGKKWYEGKQYLCLKGNFGETFCPIGQFRYNIEITQDIPLKLWLEYQTSDGVELQLRISFFPSGSTDMLTREWVIEGKTLEQQIEIDPDASGYLAIAIYSKGDGTLKLGALHHRWSRGQWGEFILGGNIFADQNRQEVMSYFNPGDLKPPLNVYFSGFRGAEGFEGYRMMRNMKAPFLLFSDPRLEGGSFYLGSETYEEAIVDRIQDCLDYLGFTREQLILSGLSMGSFGALYYSTRLQPHALILGKPLANLGTMAAHERLKRPNGFPTSLDLLKIHGGATVKEAIPSLDNRFWNRFKKTVYRKTTFALAYMKNDDYDDQAFYQLVEESQSNHAKIIGKGWVGRHNDNSSAITTWFLQQFQRILEKDFGRKEK